MTSLAVMFTWEYPKIRGTLFTVLKTRILLFRVLYKSPLFTETPTLRFGIVGLFSEGWPLLVVQVGIWVAIKIRVPFWVP